MPFTGNIQETGNLINSANLFFISRKVGKCDRINNAYYFDGSKSYIKVN